MGLLTLKLMIKGITASNFAEQLVLLIFNMRTYTATHLWSECGHEGGLWKEGSDSYLSPSKAELAAMIVVLIGKLVVLFTRLRGESVGQGQSNVREVSCSSSSDPPEAEPTTH